MPTKLKIKMGHIEFEYEGEAVYDNEAVKDLFSHIESLVCAAPPGTFDILPSLNEAEKENGGEGGGEDISADIASFSIRTVAARLGGKSAKDVTLAAAAHFQICQSKKSFSRKELLSNMQEAHGFYNKIMSRNLSSTLKRLVSGKFMMIMNGDQMSLSASELTRLKARIAQP